MSVASEGGSCSVRVVSGASSARSPDLTLGGSNPRAGVGDELEGCLPRLAPAGAGASPGLPRLLPQCGRTPVPIQLAPPQRLSSLPPEPLTISKEVGNPAEGPRGQVPGLPLQLAQQAFHFCLQVLHRLLHCLEQAEMGGLGGWEQSRTRVMPSPT